MKKTYLALSLLLVALLLPAASSAFEIGARGYYWFPSLDGNVKVDETATIGDTIDFEKDLGVEDENYPSFEVFLGGGRHHLSLTYTNIDYSGKKTLTEKITFNGKEYDINALVESSIEYKMMDLLYQYDFLNLENVLAGFSLGAVFQVKYLDGDVGLKSTTAGSNFDEKQDFTFPIPMIGLNLHIGLLADVLEARLRGTAIGYAGNTIYELMGDISWTPLPFLDVHGGYKTFVIDIDEDDVVFDYDMSGPYVALSLSF